MFIKHQIEKLYRLEIRSEVIVSKSDLHSGLTYDNDNDEYEEESVDMPRRVAAENGKLMHRLMGN